MDDGILNQEQIEEELESSDKLRQLMTGFVLCNGLRKRELEEDKFVYEGNSPDEITLANFARKLNFVIESKTEKMVSVINPKGFSPFFSVFCAHKNSCQKLISRRSNRVQNFGNFPL